MTDPYSLAHAFVAALTNDPDNAVMDWRAIHDTRKDIPAIPFRGTVAESWQTIQHYNAQGYGIFANVAEMDGLGRKLENVMRLRAHYVDLDNISAQQNFEAASRSIPAPSFVVNTSPGKYHVYWPVVPYSGNDRFEQLQRKLGQVYDADRGIIDATRVMRVPGTYHMKQPEHPHLVTCSALAGYGQQLTIDHLEQAYAHVNIIDSGMGERHELGNLELAAPSIEWLQRALELSDPNDFDRAEWIAFTAAFKQAGWTLTDEDTLYQMWANWCARYNTVDADGQPLVNDPGENKKQWDSLRNTELGWKSLTHRVPPLKAALAFGNQVAQTVQQQSGVPAGDVPAPPMPEPPPLDCKGEVLTSEEQKVWFKDCIFITKLGKILAPDGRFHSATTFNGAYGGKQFIITSGGKLTDEAWKAALRSTLWTIPKVDHTRFIPQEPSMKIIKDALGRDGVNMYVPPKVEATAGDVSPFLNHMRAMIPDEGDLNILLGYLAHNVRFPGYKIPWAPVIQSVEGVGKGVIKTLMTYAMGRPYVYFPKADELVNSGSKFNGWMRNRTFILADEIKVDEKRNLIEVLKPMISEEIIEMESKGVDQELEDNFSNWMFFTNFKDAVPVNKNGRRYAIFFSPIQTEADLEARGMGEAYFNALYNWLNNGGAAIITEYLLRYPIERGQMPMRAPKTTSWDEAVKIGRSPVERVLIDAIDSGVPGFKGGWVSSESAQRRIKSQGAARATVPPHVIAGYLESLGYVRCGRAPRAYFEESGNDNIIPELFHYGQVADVNQFGSAQGWE